MPPLMLVDTASLYFRAFYGVPESVRAPDGSPVNAVRGFLDMLARLVDDRRPGRLVCCLDADWRPAFRVAAIPSYKAHRVASSDEEDVPPALAVQVPVLLDVLDALGVATLGVAGYEADDVIATLAAREPGPTDVVTGDRDLFAVVDDAREVRVLYVARGVAKREVVDDATVRAKYGVGAQSYAALAILRGDPSDGLPGVPGIGEKTAAGILGVVGDLPGLLSAVATGGEGLPRRAALVEHLDYLRAAADVVPVRLDVEIPADLDPTLPGTVTDPERLVALSTRYGLDSTLNRLVAAMTAARKATAAHEGPSAVQA